ncbi:MAG TPA: hypothetical protein HPQ03_00450 [Deltaproteobacteria bacterium]|nr:hypothetical protein [Deltaproteobacteria bacterium]
MSVSSVYKSRNPINSVYYQCVEDYFEFFEQIYEERYERRYGFYRPYVMQVIRRYLDCGILNNGFARMNYNRETGQVAYQSKDGKQTEVLNALEWLAAMGSHVPNRGEQMVRYYGHYSNVALGKRKKEGADDNIPCILVAEVTDKAFRRNWARLIQKIYEVDPLICPKCSGAMRVIAFIEDEEVIKKILKHLTLWNIKRKPPPKATFTRLWRAPPYDELPSFDDALQPRSEEYVRDPDLCASGVLSARIISLTGSEHPDWYVKTTPTARSSTSKIY